MHGNGGNEPQQRIQILDAALDITGVGGYGALSIRMITEVAKVSRSTFLRLFGSPDAVLLAIHDACMGQLTECMVEADDTDRPAVERLEACLAALVDYLVEDPIRADTLAFGAHGAGGLVLQAQEDALASLTTELVAMLAAEGMSEVEADRGARFGVGAVREVLRMKIAEGSVDELPPLVPQLVTAAFPTVARATAVER